MHTGSDKHYTNRKRTHRQHQHNNVVYAGIIRLKFNKFMQTNASYSGNVVLARA